MFPSKTEIIYPPIYWRLLFYLFAAHYIVSYGEPESVFELLKLPFYYLALIGSLIITLIIGEYILAVTKYLDRLYLRLSFLVKRIYNQALWGIISTVLLAVIMASLYFWFRGTDIVTAGYFRYDFTLVVGFILLLNTVYLIIGLVQYRHSQLKIRIPNKEKPKVNTHEAIIAIYPVERGFVAILKSGESIIWTKTIEQSIQELPEEDYFLINRSDILHREIIAGYQPSDSRRLKLILKEPLAFGRPFFVSQRKVVGFKRWFKANLDE